MKIEMNDFPHPVGVVDGVGDHGTVEE